MQPAERPARDHPHFLAGGGEIGARMRAYDWAATPLGPPEDWPQSLKTIVRVMLDSRYAMWMLWGDGLTFFCNDAYLPTVGLKRDWVLGARSDKVWEEIWPDIGPRIQRVLDRGESTWDEGLLLFLERSGFPEETYHTFSYSPVYDDDARVAGMLCVVTEVTERVVGERRLEILRELGSGAVASVEDTCRRALAVLARYPLDLPFAAVYLLEEGGTRARLAAATRELSSEEAPPLVVLEDPRTPAHFRSVATTGVSAHLADVPALGIRVAAGPWPDLIREAWVLPVRSAGRDATIGVLVAGLSPRRPVDAAYTDFVELVVDRISAALADAQAWEADRRRAEALAEIDRAKTAFFSNVSHEFRTPLTLMLGPAEELATDGRLPADARDRIALVHRNALRLQKLVNSLLEFSRLEAGRVRARYEPVDLAALTRDLASTFRAAIERAGLVYAVACEPLGAPGYVDREMWEKVVLNLLSNAFKFTLHGRIDVRLRQDGAHAVIEVADTGAGIPAAELPRLFERFHRVEGTRGRTYEGSGIGLALVQELVRLHGGQVEAESEPGRGSTFRVRLPLGADHLPRDAVRDATAHATPGAVSSGAQAFVEEALRWLPDDQRPAGGRRLGLPGEAGLSRADRRFAETFGSRIVVADDNADLRAYLRELLAPHYVVEAVADGEAALAAVRRERPALVVSDVMMPRLDGFALIAALRADPLLSTVPVLLLSARAGEESRIEGLDAGADDYVVKPFSARELLARVGALLERDVVRRKSEERLRRAFRQAPSFVAIMEGSEHRFTFVNDAYVRLFGERELVGRTVREAFPDVEGQGLFELLDGVWTTGERHVAQARPLSVAATATTPARELYLDFVYAPMLDDAGRVCGIFVEGYDVTERTLATRALRESEARLQAADRQKDEFLAMLAHELRNPLAPIRSAGELLARTTHKDSRAHVAVEMIRRQTAQLSRLVDDLLDVSRITQGRIRLQTRVVALATVIGEAVESVQPLVRQRGHELAVALEDGTLRVVGDPARLVQCVVNLLTNAVKYTPPGGHVRVGLRRDGDAAVIEVEDDGNGIAPELLPRVFDLFVQSDRTLDRSQGGLGIGLSVVKRLVDMHGGTVAVRSAGVDRGSTFEIRLPAVDDATLERQPSRGARPAARRVLVVDDNVDAAQALALVLQLDGHEVRAAFGAAEALGCALESPPDVVLLDIGLPEMDGYAVARELRRKPELAGVRLVALTGYGQPEDRERARDAGFDAHLVKPVDPELLDAALAGEPRGAARHP